MFFVISGPSGCGKSVLVRQVLEEIDSVEFSVSYTTRKRRNLEIEGKDYYFVNEDEFKRMIDKQKLIEWAIVHGNHYGTSRREVEKKGTGKDLLLDIDVQGAQQVIKKVKKAAFIFILPPGFQELKRRLEKRGDESPALIKRRLEMAQKEVRHYPEFDFILINDRLDKAVQDLKAIILSRRCRLDIQQKVILPILKSFAEGY